MGKKIRRQLLGISFFAAAITLLLAVVIFYQVFNGEVFAGMESTANVLRWLPRETLVQYVNDLDEDDESRLTLIDETGQVLADNRMDADALENHNDREEVSEARTDGEGTSIRRSSSIRESAYYYACLLEDGTVLRVCRERENVLSLIYHMFLPLSAIVAVLIAVCIMVSRLAVRSLMEPFDQLTDNLDNEVFLKDFPYPELTPLMETIRVQHADILNNATMRQDFTASVSHELKTPLASISGYSELIANGMVGEGDASKFAEKIHSNAQRLLTLINDIIRLNELDTSEQQEAFEKVDLYQVVQDCVSMLQLNAHKHKVTLEAEGESAFIRANRNMMDEVVYNLCDNAIRYNNEDGNVLVKVQPMKDKVRLMVMDNGIGIPEAHQSRIFERFYRVDKSRSKATGGTGLGLAIVKHILLVHDAEVKVESRVGKGTVITVDFHAYKESNG